MPFVDQHNGMIKNGSLNILRNWNRDCTLESYLTAIRDELKNNLKKSQNLKECKCLNLHLNLRNKNLHHRNQNLSNKKNGY